VQPSQLVDEWWHWVPDHFYSLTVTIIGNKAFNTDYQLSYRVNFKKYVMIWSDNNWFPQQLLNFVFVWQSLAFILLHSQASPTWFLLHVATYHCLSDLHISYLYDYNTNNPCKIFYFVGCIRPMSSTNDGLKSDSSADSSTDSDLSSDGLVALLIDCEPLWHFDCNTC